MPTAVDPRACAVVTGAAAGDVLSSRTVGNLLRLPVLQETTNAAGETVRQVRDTAGNLIEYTVSGTGSVLNARILQQGAPPRP